jgi:predicted transcriptional regulator
LKAGAIIVSGDLYSDGVVNTTMLQADNATLLHNRRKETIRPFTRIRAFFSGRDIQDEKNARIRDIEANKLHIEDYSVQKIIGKDVVIGKGCFVDKVIATANLRIHKSAKVTDFIGSVMPEYYE